MIAADLVRTAKFDSPSVYQYLDSFVSDIPDRGVGFRDPRLMALVPWYANIAIRHGVPFDNAAHMVCHHGRYLDEKVKKAAEGAAYFQSSLQMVAFRINAFDVKLEDTRRAMCTGFLMHGFFGFGSQLPYFIATKIDQMSERALGAVVVGQGAESDSSIPAVEEGERADE